MLAMWNFIMMQVAQTLALAQQLMYSTKKIHLEIFCKATKIGLKITIFNFPMG